MLIAKLTISYDRGMARNDEKDLTEGQASIFGRGMETKDGKVIRGLGMHFRSKADMEATQERDRDAKRIYNEFRSRFLATPLEGVYVVGQHGEAKAFIDSLTHRPDINVFVSEFELTAPGELNASEIRGWAEKVRRQLASISLGRCKEADEDGLRALETLATCPILKKETGNRIKELVASVRDQKLDRVELKRSLETLSVGIETMQLQPRATPQLVEA